MDTAVVQEDQAQAQSIGSNVMGLQDIMGASKADQENKAGEKDVSDGLEKAVEKLAKSRDDYDKLNQKYSSMNGVISSQDAKIKDLTDRLEAMSLQNQQLQSQFSQQHPPQDFLKPDEAESIKNTRPVIGKMIGNSAENILGKVKEQFAENKTANDKRLSQMQKDTFRGLVRMAHKDVNELLESEEYAKYKMKRNPLANRTNGELFQDAINNFDAEHAINWLTEFKSAHPDKFSPKADQEAVFAPSGADGGVHAGNGANGPMIKESAWKEAFEIYHNKKGSRKDWLAFKAIWDPALKEGRVLMGQ